MGDPMIKRVLLAFAVVAATGGAAQAQTQYTILGSVLIFAGNFCPYGFMPMDGQLLPINQNQALFSILGTTYGGNGTTTFALPNLQGRAAVGVGTGLGLPTVTLGETFGSPSVTLNSNQIPLHNAPLTAGGGHTGTAGT